MLVSRLRLAIIELPGLLNGNPRSLLRDATPVCHLPRGRLVDHLQVASCKDKANVQR